MENKVSLEEIVSLCKRRGFIFQSSDIYGRLQGIYDYDPMGSEKQKSLLEKFAELETESTRLVRRTSLTR